MQSLRAFGSLQDALSFIVNAYPQIAQWRATGQRLTTFVNHLNEIEEKAQTANALQFVKNEEHAITAKHLTISTPQGLCLLRNIEEKLIHGKH